MREFLKLTTWFIAVRLGKGVVMAFVLIMFTAQFNHIQPDITYIALTFTYFLITQKKWSGQNFYCHKILYSINVCWIVTCIIAYTICYVGIYPDKMNAKGHSLISFIIFKSIEYNYVIAVLFELYYLGLLHSNQIFFKFSISHGNLRFK